MGAEQRHAGDRARPSGAARDNARSASSEAAVGLSNVFQVEGFEIDAGTFLRECARQARCLHADRALVGYGPRSEVDALASLGIVPIGPLTVWVSP